MLVLLCVELGNEVPGCGCSSSDILHHSTKSSINTGQAPSAS